MIPKTLAMAYTIRFTESADQDLQWFSKRDQRIIIDETEIQLRNEPMAASSHRKKLKPKALAEWELRIGDFRVFYSTSEEQVLVSVVAVGQKQHNRLLVRGMEFQL